MWWRLVIGQGRGIHDRPSSFNCSLGSCNADMDGMCMFEADGVLVYVMWLVIDQG